MVGRGGGREAEMVGVYLAGKDQSPPQAQVGAAWTSSWERREEGECGREEGGRRLGVEERGRWQEGGRK